MDAKGYECLTDNIMHNRCNADDDEVNYDSDTSTSFSLQECMNEFRARRIRRLSWNQHCQEIDNYYCNTRGTAEVDIIRQNLCNREQERKRKPCKNGFCYCFTSDSGDGVPTKKTCHVSRASPKRIFRYGKSSECALLINAAENSLSSSKSIKKSRESIPHVKTVEGKSKSKLKVISSLETSAGNDPLIQIVQELRDNCVISTVKVNKCKMQQLERNPLAEENTINTASKSAVYKNKIERQKFKLKNSKQIESPPTKYIPTAPILEQVCYERGHLLRKRLSISHSIYKPRDINQAPPKPPRKCLAYSDTYGSSVSTSSTVREAETILDSFLAQKFDTSVLESYSHNGAKSKKRGDGTNNGKSTRNYNKNYYALTPEKSKYEDDKLIFKYPVPVLGERNCTIKLKTLPMCERNMRSLNNVSNSINISSNDANIKKMLDCNVETQECDFYSFSQQAEPQCFFGPNIMEYEKPPEWQIPAKVSLDTVDGVVNLNLESNIWNKITPVKTKLFNPSKNKEEVSRKQKFLWAEQLKNLSPWTNRIRASSKNNIEQNLCSSSKAFIISSKKKIMNFVSPKKNNNGGSGVKMRNVAIQTLCNDNNRSPPNSGTKHHKVFSSHSSIDSYNVPLECSIIQNTVQNGTNSSLTQFDYSRTVHSPPKKACSTGHRKLKFPLKCIFDNNEYDRESNQISIPTEVENQKITYRSFNSELYQDATVSNINPTLANIVRSKPETDDYKDVCTFLESDFVANKNSSDINSFNSKYIGRGGKENKISHSANEDHFNDPIYSEIADSDVYMSKAVDLNNYTALQQSLITNNPNILYAQVNKRKFDTNKLQLRQMRPQLSLIKIMQNSLKSEDNTAEPVKRETLLPSHCQTFNNIKFIKHNYYNENELFSEPLRLSKSLNNIRVMERNSYPESQHHIKSALSPFCSEICLKNIYDVGMDKKYSEKDKSISRQLGIQNNTEDFNYFLHNYYSEPPRINSDNITAKRQRHFFHTKYNFMNNLNAKNVKTLEAFKNFKHVLYKSFHISKSFLRNEGKRWCSFPNGPINSSLINPASAASKELCMTSASNLEDELTALSEQLSQKIISYRRFPNSEDSMETVEAERLLLFSTLYQENQVDFSSKAVRNHTIPQDIVIHFIIDDILLPIISEVNEDIFFNYYYIITFECGGVVKSTKSAECTNGVIKFTNNVIEFVHSSKSQTDYLVESNENGVKCNIYILRLRKINNFSNKLKRTILKTVSKSSSSSSSSNSNEIVSKFCLHASFTLNAKEFVPYEYIHEASDNFKKIFIRASRFCTLPLQRQTNSTHLSGQICLRGETEICIRKVVFQGFLNVQDANKPDTWNRRWCSLDGIYLYIWQDANILNVSPLMAIDLRNVKRNTCFPLTCYPKELCVHLHSFCLHTNEKSVFCAADTHENVCTWLLNLNIVLDFVTKWLS